MPKIDIKFPKFYSSVKVGLTFFFKSKDCLNRKGVLILFLLSSNSWSLLELMSLGPLGLAPYFDSNSSLSVIEPSNYGNDGSWNYLYLTGVAIVWLYDATLLPIPPPYDNMSNCE